jgi:hypothetical protein
LLIGEVVGAVKKRAGFLKGKETTIRYWYMKGMGVSDILKCIRINMC